MILKNKNIAEMLKTRIEDGEELIVVVSAMGKTTDQLMNNVSSLTLLKIKNLHCY